MREVIVLFDAKKNEVIVKYDVSNVIGEIMDYYYYYFDGYENYMSYLLKMGAIECNEEQEEDIINLILIYEIE